MLSSVGDTDKADSVVVDMSSTTKDLVAALDLTTLLKKDELKMRQHEKWMKMASFYVSIGEKDCALTLMAKIEGNDAAMEQSQSAGYSTPHKEPEAVQEAPAPSDAGEVVDDDNMEVVML